MERFLYRLSQSQHADSFVLKGALLLTAWKAPASRPTVDIDLLGRTTNELDEISRMVQEVCRVALAVPIPDPPAYLFSSSIPPLT
jgi:hypothetical protein